MTNRSIYGLLGAASISSASGFAVAADMAVRLAARNLTRILIAAVGLTLSSIACLAEGKIGNAITIKNQVEGVTAGGTQSLATGSEVFSNELVRTAGESKAQLLFLDNTNLSIGPLSTIRLDSFVYDPNSSKGNVVLRAGIGAFRFITGLQDKKSYAIKTEYATIGVRGTEFYLLNTRSEVRIQLIEGKVIGTTISGQSFSLDQVNEVLSIDSKGAVHHLGISTKPLVDLADLGPPITNYAGLYPPAINLAGGLAVAAGAVGILELIELNGPPTLLYEPPPTWPGRDMGPGEVPR
jgi:hypothetical protein